MRFSNEAILAAVLVAGATVVAPADAFCQRRPQQPRAAIVAPSSRQETTNRKRTSRTAAAGPVRDEDAETTTPTAAATAAAAASATETSSPDKEFKNDGPFAWMLPYMDVMGFRKGKKLYGAVPMDNNHNNRLLGQQELSSLEAAERRRRAVAELQNIGDEERARRAGVGKVLAGLSVVYAAWSGAMVADGDGGHVVRAALAVPLLLSVGYQKSARAGL